MATTQQQAAERLKTVARMESALDSDDPAAIDAATQPLLNALGLDVHEVIGTLVKAVGRNASRQCIRARAAQVRS